MSGRIGAECKVVGLCGGAQVIEHEAGTDARELFVDVQLKDLIHVLRPVHHDGNVTSLPRERSAAAARENRRAELAASRDGGEDIVNIFRDHDSYRNLTIVRTVGGIERAAAGVKADFAPDVLL